MLCIYTIHTQRSCSLRLPLCVFCVDKLLKRAEIQLTNQITESCLATSLKMDDFLSTEKKVFLLLCVILDLITNTQGFIMDKKYYYYVEVIYEELSV